MISAAKRPYIYFGGGVITGKASAELIKLAEKTDSPMGCSLMGLSAVPTDHPRFLGMSGMHGHYAATRAEDEADLVIALGVRFSDRATGTGDRFSRNFRIIHIDIDNAELNKNVCSDLTIQGDIKDALFRLIPMLSETKHLEWNARIAELRAEEKALTDSALAAAKKLHPGKLAPYEIIDTISRYTSEGDIIATDVGQHQMWTAQRFPLKKPRTFISSGGLGTMGFGMGAAIGAAKANGKRAVLITGDGSFGMDLNELATAISQEIKLVVVIMNNGVLGMVRQWQTALFDKRYSGTTLNRKTDFVKVAEAFGAKGGRASNTAELEKLAAEAFAYEGTFVIDCAVDSDEAVLPIFPPNGNIDDIITGIE